jgi:hypothetical protein
VEIYLHSPNTLSWRDDQSKHRDKYPSGKSYSTYWIREKRDPYLY